MKSIVVLTGIFLTGAILLGCAPKGAPLDLVEEKTTAVVTTVAKEGWEAEWERTMAEARKEGKVVLFGNVSPLVREALGEGFKRFSGIDVEFVVGRGGEVATKILTERRAGLFTGDVYLGGGQTMVTTLRPVYVPLRPHIILPEVLDTSLWFLNKLHWIDKEEKYMNLNAGTDGSVGDIIVNTELVKRDEITSYYDLLKPKWKGKIVIQDPSSAGKGSTWFYSLLTWYGVGLDFMKRLVQQEPVITREKRAQIEWVARGKYPVGLAYDVSLTAEFVRIGAPVSKMRLKEHRDGMVSQHSAITAFIDNAPHPAAAKVFINWFLSKEGQWAFAKSYPTQSFRVDVPVEHLLPEEIRQSADEYEIQNVDNILLRAKYTDLAGEIFGPLLK